MNATDLAKRLDGREYGDEITKDENQEAKANRLVVVFGYSDDNVELRGFINDEITAWDGCTFYVLSNGKVLPDEHECDCDFCGYGLMIDQAKPIEALWCSDDEASWKFKTEIPHATFNIMEDGELFCVGIVFALEAAEERMKNE